MQICKHFFFFLYNAGVFVVLLELSLTALHFLLLHDIPTHHVVLKIFNLPARLCDAVSGAVHGAVLAIQLRRRRQGVPSRMAVRPLASYRPCSPPGMHLQPGLRGEWSGDPDCCDSWLTRRAGGG